MASKVRLTAQNRLYAKRIIYVLELLPLNESIKLKDLAPKCEIVETTSTYYSKLRGTIDSIIESYCIPIVSSNNGFKIARTQEDLNKFNKKMYKQISGIKSRIERTTHAFNVFDEGKIKSYSEIIDKKPKRLELKIKNKTKSQHSFVN